MASIELELILYVDGVRITAKQITKFLNQKQFKGKSVAVKTKTRASNKK